MDKQLNVLSDSGKLEEETTNCNDDWIKNFGTLVEAAGRYADLHGSEYEMTDNDVGKMCTYHLEGSHRAFVGGPMPTPGNRQTIVGDIADGMFDSIEDLSEDVTLLEDRKGRVSVDLIDILQGRDWRHMCEYHGPLCTACAVASLVEFYCMYNDSNYILSEYELFSKIKISNSAGSTNMMAMKFMSIEGIPCTNESNGEKGLARVVKPVRLSSDINSLRSVIASGMPVLASLKVFDGCRSKQKYCIRDRRGKTRGAHTVLLVGYNDNSKVFTFKDSGGDNKYGEIDYGYGLQDCWCTPTIYVDGKSFETSRYRKSLWVLLLLNSSIRFETRRDLMMEEFTDTVFHSRPMSNKEKHNNMSMTIELNNYSQDHFVALLLIKHVTYENSKIEHQERIKIQDELTGFLHCDVRDSEARFYSRSVVYNDKCPRLIVNPNEDGSTVLDKTHLVNSDGLVNSTYMGQDGRLQGTLEVVWSNVDDSNFASVFVTVGTQEITIVPSSQEESLQEHATLCATKELTPKKRLHCLTCCTESQTVS